MSLLPNSISRILRRRTDVVRDPPGFRSGADDDDESIDFEDDAPAETSDLIDGMTVGVTYEDAAGSISQRVITCHSITSDSTGDLLRGYCHLRKAPRWFWIDGVTEVVDYRSGESHPDVHAFFAPYLPGTGPDALPDSHATVQNRVRDGVLVLSFMARADRDMHAEEAEVIARYIGARARGRAANLDLRYDEDAMMRWAAAQVPTAEQVENAAVRILESEDHTRLVAASIRELMVADGAVTDEERSAFLDLEAAFDRAAQRREA